MRLKPLIISIAIIILAALIAYLLIAVQLLEEPVAENLPSKETGLKTVPPAITVSGPTETPEATSTNPATQKPRLVQSGNKLLEVFGKITDQNNNPIENAFISEERYFFNTRSDAGGQFRILLDMPVNRYPILHFLRSGFRGQRIKLQKLESQERPSFQLDVKMVDAQNTVTVRGWLGNDFGMALEGARIDLVLSEGSVTENYFMTLFTDSAGRFEFEGVLIDKTYTLSAIMSNDYPHYQDPDFYISQNPDEINIVLDTLKFVDISGMIMNRQGLPVPNFEMYISNQTTGAHSRKIISDSSGFFSLENYPLGEVNLSTQGPQFYKISGINLTETDYSNLTLVVDQGDYFLSGWVSDENGIAIEKALVTLDSNYREESVETLIYRSQGTDSSGRFAFDKIGTGRHTITVYANGYEKQIVKHFFANQSDDLYIKLKPQAEGTSE